MYKISKRTEDFSADSVPCFMDEAKVHVSDSEAAALRKHDEDTVEHLFEVAECLDEVHHEAGSYIGAPSYHLESNIAIVHQRYGMDW